MNKRTRKNHADKPSQCGKQCRFRKELHENILPACTERLSDTDFSRSFRNRYQHDIHNPDTADQKGNRRNAANCRRETAHDTIHLFHFILNGRNIPVLGFTIFHTGKIILDIRIQAIHFLYCKILFPIIANHRESICGSRKNRPWHKGLSVFVLRAHKQFFYRTQILSIDCDNGKILYLSMKVRSKMLSCGIFGTEKLQCRVLGNHDDRLPLTHVLLRKCPSV